MKGRHFSSDAEVIAAAETWLDGQPSELFFFEWLAKVRVWSLQLVSFLVGLRTYQHPGNNGRVFAMVLFGITQFLQSLNHGLDGRVSFLGEHLPGYKVARNTKKGICYYST